MSKILIYTIKTYISNDITFINNAKIISRRLILNTFYLKFYFFEKKLIFTNNNIRLKLNIINLFPLFKIN